MSEEHENTAPRLASAPFDNRCGADVIFRTSDNVDFYLHRAILSLASTVFDGLSTIPQPSSAGAPHSASPNEPPRVDEDSHTLDCLLRYSYPVDDPEITDLEVLDRVLGAAIKYALDATVKPVLRALRGFADAHALHVYAISCRHGLEDDARRAAEAWKRTREAWPAAARVFAETSAALCYAPHMAALPAGAYFRLVQFVTGDGAAAGGAFAFCDPPDVPDAQKRAPGAADAAGFPFDQPGADVVFRSSDHVDFRAHRVVVELQIAASPVFPLQAVLLAPPEEDVTVDGLPVIQTRERSHVLQRLLKLCYPAMPRSTVSTWTPQQCSDPTNIRVVSAALRYGFTPMVDLYRDRILSCDGASLGAYCACVIFGWHLQATAVASNMPHAPDLPAYHETLEILPAEEYYILLGRLHDSWMFFEPSRTPKRR